MFDIGTMNAAVGSIKSIADIAKMFMDMSTSAAVQSKAIELNRVVLSALDSALTAKAQQSAMIDRIGELEAEIARLEAWQGEKQKYELKKVGPGSFAYSLKAEERGGEPSHWLCATCYQQSRKSILQSTGQSRGREWVYRCASCKAEVLGPFGID